MKVGTGVLIILSVAAAACAAPAPPTSLPEADITALRNASADFQKAVRDTAWQAWVNLYTDDATIGPPNSPPLTGHDALVAWVRALPPAREFTLRPVDIDGRGDLAYVYGKYSWVIMVPGQPELPDSGKYIEVWRKQSDGNWKTLRDVFNADVPLATPAPTAVKK